MYVCMYVYVYVWPLDLSVLGSGGISMSTVWRSVKSIILFSVLGLIYSKIGIMFIPAIIATHSLCLCGTDSTTIFFNVCVCIVCIRVYVCVRAPMCMGGPCVYGDVHCVHTCVCVCVRAPMCMGGPCVYGECCLLVYMFVVRSYIFRDLICVCVCV